MIYNVVKKKNPKKVENFLSVFIQHKIMANESQRCEGQI
jgi:hypothetical protein